MEVTIIIESRELETFNETLKLLYHIEIMYIIESEIKGWIKIKLKVDDYWLEELFQLGRLFEMRTTLPY